MMLPFEGSRPSLSQKVYVAPGAYLIGKVEIGCCSSVWFNAVLRGDIEKITIGRESNVQDNVTVHTDKGYPTVIGNRVVIGHNAVLHGCTVEDGALIGMGALLLNGSKVGSEAIVGAGSLITPGMEVPARTLVVGAPAKVIRELSPEEYPGRQGNYYTYMKIAQKYLAEK